MGQQEEEKGKNSTFLPGEDQNSSSLEENEKKNNGKNPYYSPFIQRSIMGSYEGSEDERWTKNILA